MTKPHEHKELILKWVDGAEIEAYDGINDKWVPVTTPTWQVGCKYRIKPAAPVIETKMTPADFKAMFNGRDDSIYDALRLLANVAIRRALADGQVVTADHLEAAQEHEMNLDAARAKRDMAVAGAVVEHVNATQGLWRWFPDDNDLAAIIAKVKP